MLKKKKKLSRKEIKEDKLISLYYKSYQYVTDNSRRLMMYGVGVVVLIVLIIFYVNHRAQQNKAAGYQLSQVMNLYDGGAYLEAIEGQAGTNVLGLKKIVEQYGSTENGETAKIYLANSYNYLGKSDDALKYYEDYDGSINMYKAAALAGAAGCYADKNNYAKAAELYKKAAHVSKDDVQNPNYLLHAGINYLASGDTNKAKTMFDQIKKDYATSSVGREVRRYLVQVQQ